MKHFLQGIAADNNAILLLSSIFIQVVAGLATLANPIRVKNAWIRYLYAIIWVISWIMIIGGPVDILARFLLTRQPMSLWYVIFILSIGPAVGLAVRRLFKLAAQSPKVAESFKMQFAWERRDLLRSLAAISSYLAFEIVMVLFLRSRYRLVDPFALIHVGLIVPVIEEIAFRLLMPILARDDESQLADYVIFSIVFQIAHFKAASFFLFPFSLYSYFIQSTTKKVINPVIGHSLHNVMNAMFLYIP
jgi:membrane protease YdiL (CAAX protease family)